MSTVTAVLVGGLWDGHTEQVTLDGDGLPPQLIPRHRDTTGYTEDTGRSASPSARTRRRRTGGSTSRT